MDRITPLILLVHGFATGILTTWLGLLLVNIRPNVKKLLIVGVCYAVMNSLIRSTDTSLGLQFTFLTILLICIVIVNWNLSFIKSMIVITLGTIILALGEILSMSAICSIANITYPYIETHHLVDLFLPAPQIIMSLGIIYFCLKSGRFIFNFRNQSSSIPNEKRVRIIVTLASTMLLLFLIQITFNIYSGLYVNKLETVISTAKLTILSTITMVSAFIIMIFIIQQLFILLSKESKYITQSAYVQTLDELYTATRAESHDRINHMQTLYGFVQLGDLEETRAYLEELIGEIVVSRNYLATGHPALSALFYIKTGLATSRGIQLDIITETRVENLALPPHELNRILGNLINNAFDSVATLPRENRKVTIEVTKKDKKYRFRIGNYGKLDPEIMKHIFNRGYSTKVGEHQGLGLFIVRQLVEKYRGHVEAENHDGMVFFTVDLPESTLRSDANERLISSSGEHSGGQFDSGF